MALLSAEDVLNKAFSKTKYREGFDQDEVDDFLDEVANTIAALTAERDELQQRLAQAQAGGAMPAAPAVPAAGSSAPSGAPQSLVEAATDPTNPPSATSMLSMAQKLHDEYVQAGEEERDRIVDEAKAKAESIIEGAEADARARIRDLEGERATVERAIDDLRRFERDYRGHLKNYLENLLGDLEHSQSKGSQGPVAAASPAAPSRRDAITDEVPTAPQAAETAPAPQDRGQASEPFQAPQQAPAAQPEPAAQPAPAAQPEPAAQPASAAQPEPSKPVEFPQEWAQSVSGGTQPANQPEAEEPPRWNF